MVTDACVAMLPEPELTAAFAAAREGKTGELDEVRDALFGGLAGVLRAGVGTLQTDGLAQPVLARDEKGKVLESDGEPVVLRHVQHPALYGVLEIAKILGITAGEQLLTPKSALKAQVKREEHGAHLKRTAEIKARLLPKKKRRRRRR